MSHRRETSPSLIKGSTLLPGMYSLMTFNCRLKFVGLGVGGRLGLESSKGGTPAVPFMFINILKLETGLTKD